jgi:ParB family chromosome partitioning protein
LSEPVKAFVRSGKISAGHARLLVGQPNAEEIAQEIVATGMSVRQLEQDMRDEGARQAGEIGREQRSPARAAAVKDADTRALERRLSDALGLDVTIDHKASGAGAVHVKYRDLDQLDGVVRKLGG